MRSRLLTAAAALLLAGGFAAVTTSPAEAANPRCPRYSDSRQGQPGYPPASCKLKVNKTTVYRHTWVLISSPGYTPGEQVNIDIRDGRGQSLRMCTQIAGRWGTIYKLCEVPVGISAPGMHFISALGTRSLEWRTATVNVPSV